jgi:mannose-1-phosphate guanylyltransferase/phosphomannomutase
MVPVANIPVMEHVINLLQSHDIKDIYALLYFQPQIIKDYFKDGERLGVKIKYIEAEEDLGTAGAVKCVQEFMNETFIVISADIVTDFDLSSAIQFHKEKKASVTILLTRVKDPLSFGIVLLDKNGRITRFLEKPSWGEVFSDTVNTGIYIIEPRMLEYIPKGKNFDFSKDLFPALLQMNEALYGYVCKGYWKDIGNIEDYRVAHQELLLGRVRINIKGERKEGGVFLGKNTKVSPSAKLEGGVIIGDGCSIGPNTLIQNSVIGDNTTVEEKAKIVGSVIWESNFIGKGAELRENIVARSCYIKEGAFLQEKAVVSDECVIGEGSELRANIKIWPYKIVEDGATLSTSLIWGERWTKNIFGTYGVSGLANIEITPEFACRLGAAYGATFLKGSSVLTSRDGHKVSRAINRALISGILSTGVNVYNLSNVPTPVTRYQVAKFNLCGGVHVRRAPYEARMLEINFFDNVGMDISAKKEKAIEQLFFREDFRRVKIEETGELTFPYRAIECYREGFLDLVEKDALKERRFKIVIDYAFGSAAHIMSSILEEVGCEVVAINSHLDAKKLSKEKGAMHDALRRLSNIVKGLNADVGFLLDTEAEKLFLVDENGQIVPSDKALVAFCMLVAHSDPEAKVAVPVNATRLVEEFLNDRVRRTQTSARAMMEQRDVTLVANRGGGFIFPAFHPAFDGMFAAVKLLELLAKEEREFSALLDEIPPFYLLHERVPCPFDKKGTIMRGFVESFSGKRMELLDGIKIYEGKDWVLLIPDQDRPLFHIYAESDNPTKTRELLNYYTEKIKMAI